jgi:hypothetical protein
LLDNNRAEARRLHAEAGTWLSTSQMVRPKI